MASRTILIWISITWILGNVAEPSAALKCIHCAYDPSVNCISLPKDRKNLLVECKIELLAASKGGGIVPPTVAPSNGTAGSNTTSNVTGAQPQPVITTPPALQPTPPSSGSGTTPPPGTSANSSANGTTGNGGGGGSGTPSGGTGGVTFEATWNSGTGDVSKDKIWVCVKEDVYVAAKLPPGVKGKSKDEWESGSSADYTKPTFVNRYCGLVSKSYALDKHPSTIDERGGKFAVRTSFCKTAGCNHGVKHGQSLGIMLMGIAVMVLLGTTQLAED